MSKFYIANENGDWWTMDTETGQGVTLFVISEADLNKAIPNCGYDLGAQDKLEQVITEHGEAIDFDFSL